MKEKINDEEKMEFIKTLKRSEYYMVDQLKREITPKILSLLLSSNKHRNAFSKILNECHVLEGIATKKNIGDKSLPQIQSLYQAKPSKSLLSWKHETSSRYQLL